MWGSRGTRCGRRSPPTSRPRYQRAVKGSIVDAIEPAVRALSREFPTMPTTVIAERIGWQRSITVLKDRTLPEVRVDLGPQWYFPGPPVLPNLSLPLQSRLGLA